MPSHPDDVLADAWRDAWRFAAEAHHGQTFPGTELPYDVHVASVAAETLLGLEDAAQPDRCLALQCALLHDVLEDTAVPAEALGARFGEAVLAGVRALSKDASLPREQRMADSLRRIRAQPRAVWCVKLADRITNLDTPPAFWSAEKVAAYRAEASEILAALGDASPRLAARLQRRIAVYGR
ncbi:MAG: HD domain-containing protein [Polyangiales bacterium]